MIEEDLVADLHVVTHHVAGLVIADAVPGFATIALEVVDAVHVRFAFHQPISHVFNRLSFGFKLERRTLGGGAGRASGRTGPRIV